MSFDPLVRQRHTNSSASHKGKDESKQWSIRGLSWKTFKHIRMFNSGLTGPKLIWLNLNLLNYPDFSHDVCLSILILLKNEGFKIGNMCCCVCWKRFNFDLFIDFCRNWFRSAFPTKSIAAQLLSAVPKDEGSDMKGLSCPSF